MKLDIHPYEGVADITFGSSPQEVASRLGPPDRQRVNNRGELRESRFENGLSVVYANGRVVEMGFARTIRDLEFNGIKLFAVSEEEALATVRKTGAKAHELLGFLVFLDLGITMTGFHDGDYDQLAVTVFERGRWDDAKEDMKPYRF